MSDSDWSRLIKIKNDLLDHRYRTKRLLCDKLNEQKSALRNIDKQIDEIDKQLEEARAAYQDLKVSNYVESGYYWGRNKWRDDPDMYDMIIEVTEPNEHGIQEWKLLCAKSIGWKERLDYEYKIGEFIGKSRK